MKDQKAFPIQGKDFDGLYARGVSGNTYDPNECPSNGFTVASQVRYTPWGIQGRPGTETFTPFVFPAGGTVVQILPYHTNNATTGAIINGYFIVEHTVFPLTNVYDSNAAVPGTPIKTVGGAFWVSFIVLFGRIAFTFHDFVTGQIAGFFQVYKPGQAASRDNGGSGPTLAGVNFASSGTAGHVTQGIHVFGLAYEFDTGHISPLGTVTGTDVNFFTLANANQQVTATGLPAAFPANVAALWIVASRLVVNSSGNAPDYEVFFVKKITVAAAAVTFDFTDESLEDSADYLFDLFARLFAPLGFTYYAGRLICWGESYNAGNTIGPSCLRVSETEDPESFSISHGFVEVFRDDGDSGVKSCWEYKGLLIIQKENRTFVTRDNGDDPNTWQVDVLDGTIGGVLFGIAKTSNQVGAIRTDYTISIGRNGVYLFDGKFNEIPLTWKIERLWQQISEQSQYLTYQILDIPTAKLLIFKVWEPIVIEVTPARPYMLVCDYSKGLSYQTVRWSQWFFTDDAGSQNDPIWLAMEDRNNMRMVVNNSAGTLLNMIIGTEKTEINAFFSDGELTSGELNPDEELNKYHWLKVKLRGVFGTVTGMNWLFGSTTNTLNLPQAVTESDVTMIQINQLSYFPQFQILFGASFGETFRLKQIVYFSQKNAQDILGQ
jgi:hypothetical protein